MRFSLRTLLIAMLLAGPLCALGWKEWQHYQARRVIAEAKANAALRQQLMIARINQQIRAVWLASSGPTQVLESPAEREIWNEQQSKISWESFPESTPARP